MNHKFNAYRSPISICHNASNVSKPLIVDSGASHHMISDTNFIKDIKPTNGHVIIANGDKIAAVVHKLLLPTPGSLGNQRAVGTLSRIYCIDTDYEFGEENLICIFARQLCLFLSSFLPSRR